jgi:DNA repair exonuclease SbcCD ATPase subunit
MSLMTVKRLELKNFMTHRQESVELPAQGSVLLWGPSGAGKCLPAGTNLWGVCGQPLRIEEVVHGKIEEVLGVVNGVVTAVKVTDWHLMGRKPMLQISLADSTILFCATTHPILTMSGCMKAEELVAGVRVGRGNPIEGSELFWEEIVSIDKVPDMECFDITVDTEEHLYLAEGVAVHNSSLLDAVGFALYGVAATRASSLEDLRNELYPDEDFGVRLTLALGDKDLQLFRGVEDNKTVVWMVGLDGEMTEGPRAVADKISELMGGMDAATFFATYYSQQGELDAMVKMAGGGRRKFVQRMLGITLLDKVSTQINRELLKSSERIQTLDDSLPQESKQEIAEGAQAAEALSESLAGQIEAAQAELEAQTISGEASAKKLSEAEAAFRLFSQLGPQIEALIQSSLPAKKAEVGRLQEQLEGSLQAKKRSSASAEQAALLAEKEAEAESLSKAEGALGLIEALTSKAQAAQAELLKLPEGDLGEDAEQLQKQLHLLHTELAVAESRRLQLQGQSSQLQGAGSCPLCLQAIENPKQLLEELEEQAQKLLLEGQSGLTREKALQERLLAAKAAQQASQSRLQAQQAADQASQALIEAQEGSQGADAERLRLLRRQLQQTATEQARIEADQAEAAKMEQYSQQLEAANLSLEELDAKLASSQKELQQSGHSPELHQKLQKETEQARQRYMQLRDRQAELREERAEQQAALSGARQTLAQYDATVADRQKAEARHSLLKRLDLSMKAFKAQMIGQIRPSLAATASGHLSALTEGKMSAVVIDEDYNIDVVTAEGVRKLSLCSGGEQARAAFALRLALTQLVSQRTDTPVGFMVFDEIFGSQDEAHRRAILESLRYLRGLYPQILLISHSGDLRESDLIDTIIDVPDSDSSGRIQVSSR